MKRHQHRRSAMTIFIFGNARIGIPRWASPAPAGGFVST
jgi:hypothetical protein